MDVDSLLTIPLGVSKLFGLDFNETSTSTWVKRLNLLGFWLSIVCVMFAMTGETFWFIEEAQKGRSFNDLTFIASCTTYGVLSVIKGLHLLTKKSKAIDLINRLKEIHPKLNNIKDDTKVREIVESTMTFFKVLLNILTVLDLVLLTLFTMKPVLLMLYTNWTAGTVEMLLPFKIKYPFVISSTIVYILVFIQQVLAASFAVIYVLSYDALYIVFCACLQMHFTIIRHRVEHIISGPNQNVDDALRNIMNEHKNLIEIVQLLQSFYSMTFFSNFATSCAMICLSLFQVSTMEDPVIWIFFLLTSLSQIFLVCYCGNMIKLSSVAVTDGVFDSKWYLASPKTRRDLTMLMARTQIPCKLTAWKYADIDIAAFAKVLSSSWSYFALLRCLYDK